MGVTTSSLEQGLLVRWSARQVSQYVAEMGPDWAAAAAAVIEHDLSGEVRSRKVESVPVQCHAMCKHAASH